MTITPQHEQLNFFAAGLLGPLCSTTTILTVQWISTLKTELMVYGRKLSAIEAVRLGKQGFMKNSFKILRFYYRAGFTHILGAIPVNGITFAATQYVRKIMTNEGQSPLTAWQGFLSTVYGALLALPVNNAIEVTYVQKQTFRKVYKQPSILETISLVWIEAGWKGFVRGIVPLGGRAVLYTGGVCWFNDVCVRLVNQILPKTWKKHPIVTQLVAGAGCGALVGYISTPFDCVRTVMQANLRGPSTWKTLSQLVQERGLFGLMNGAGSRSAYIAGFIGMMTLCKHNYPKIFPNFCFQAEVSN